MADTHLVHPDINGVHPNGYPARPDTRRGMDAFIQTSMYPKAKTISTPLKWAGGKTWFTPTMQTLVHQSRCDTFVDLFCGSCAVPLGLVPHLVPHLVPDRGNALVRIIANDANPSLIAFWRTVQAGTLSLDDIDTGNNADTYYANRADFNGLVTDGAYSGRFAALFHYLNRACYNGLWRVNQQGEFNVPFGRYKTLNLIHDWRAWTEKMQGWRFEHGDFRRVDLPTGSFVYADPPYDIPGHTAYTANGFTWQDQVDLATRLCVHDGPVVLHNGGSPRIETLYRELGFDVLRVPERRAINRDGQARGGVDCVVATRNLPDAVSTVKYIGTGIGLLVERSDSLP